MNSNLVMASAEDSSFESTKPSSQDSKKIAVSPFGEEKPLKDKPEGEMQIEKQYTGYELQDNEINKPLNNEPIQEKPLTREHEEQTLDIEAIDVYNFSKLSQTKSKSTPLHNEKSNTDQDESLPNSKWQTKGYKKREMKEATLFPVSKKELKENGSQERPFFIPEEEEISFNSFAFKPPPSTVGMKDFTKKPMMN